MKLQRLLPLAVAALTAQSHGQLSSVPGCENGKTTIEIAECRRTQLDAANSKLKLYLTAARTQAKKFDLDGSAIDSEQIAWEAYRTKHCGNVYELWRQGTVRYEMSAVCMLKVTSARTLDVWRAYLTYADGTPSVLPDPTQ